MTSLLPGAAFIAALAIAAPVWAQSMPTPATATGRHSGAARQPGKLKRQPTRY